LAIVFSFAINAYAAEIQFSVWLSLAATFFLVLLLPGGKRTPMKSWLIDAMILLRFPF